MFVKIYSAAVYGVEGKLIEVEVDIARGLPAANIVGLPDPAVRESIERVRAAVKNCGFSFPLDRITINLAPADLRKAGTAFDLAIAIGILAASGQISPSLAMDSLVIGELALNGEVRPVAGVLPLAELAMRHGLPAMLLPLGNCPEAALVGELRLQGAVHLKQLAGLDGSPAGLPVGLQDGMAGPFTGGVAGRIGSGGFADGMAGVLPEVWQPQPQPTLGDSSFLPTHAVGHQLDYADIAGQLHAKRAMLTAAAGKHNILLCGPPGTGKTMLVRRLPSILPPLSTAEALETTRIYSVCGKLPVQGAALIHKPPFRAPHHTISAIGLVGGGSLPQPGEATLAHNGVLFLDELPEFSRQTLEALRQPLEEREVTIVRARAAYRFPTAIMLAAAMNLCPCGLSGVESIGQRCTCSDVQLARYRSKISGPLLDRLDLQVEVSRPPALPEGVGLDSAAMRSLVFAARERQSARHAATGVHVNQALSGAALKRVADLAPAANAMLQAAYASLGLSMRSHNSLLKLARTIADLADSGLILEEHVAEAIQYRAFDRTRAAAR